jgi:hypothetical protein
VWSEDDEQERETLEIGFVCEVRDAQVTTLRTFESLVGEDVPPVQELEAGAEHALAIMRHVRASVAPVAWAVFTDMQTWNEWIGDASTSETPVDKGALLAQLARQGRCVLMGSQVRQHEPRE